MYIHLLIFRHSFFVSFTPFPLYPLLFSSYQKKNTVFPGPGLFWGGGGGFGVHVEFCYCSSFLPLLFPFRLTSPVYYTVYTAVRLHDFTSVCLFLPFLAFLAFPSGVPFMTCNAKICSMQRLCSWSCPVSSDSLISLCSVLLPVTKRVRSIYIPFLDSLFLLLPLPLTPPCLSYCLTQAALFLIFPFSSLLPLFSSFFSTCLVYIPCIPFTSLCFFALVT